MGKACKDCGKDLGFFSIFSSVERCEDCEKKFQIGQNAVIIESPVYFPPIQQQAVINKPVIGSIGGKIEYYKLQEWWLNALSSEERGTLISLYKPLGLNPDSLTHGKIIFSDQSVVAFLSKSIWLGQKTRISKNWV